MNPNRGRESKLHKESKTVIGRLFDESGWSVFYEQCNADVLVLHHATRFLAAIEVESSPRNVVRNIERNFAYGCRAVAVVSINERLYNQIANKIKTRSFTEIPVQLFSEDTQELGGMCDWISGFVRE